MRQMWTIAMREFSSLFRLPVGWIAVALYMLLTGIIFILFTLAPGEPATMRYFFAIAGWLLLPVAPAISMRTFSEELRSGTIEPLMTAPVTDFSLIVGKYIGAWLFLIAVLAPTVIHAVILYRFSDPAPDPGPILAGYLSLVLVGGLYLAVGCLASSLTPNQTLAFLGSLLFILAFLLVTDIASQQANPTMARILLSLSINARIADFAKGIIATEHIVFFISAAAWFVFLTILSIQSRRWR